MYHNAYSRAFLLLIVTLLIFPTLRASAQDSAVLDEIVAVVGDDIILRSEVNGLVLSFVNQQGIDYTEELWREALNQIVDDKVIAIHAERDTTIIVGDDQIEQTLDQRINQMASQLPGGMGQIEEVYGKTIVELKADLREDFREQLAGEQLRSRKLFGIDITPSEVESWFDQFPTDSLPTIETTVRLSHIVKFPEVSDVARQDAEEIIASIRNLVVNGERTIEEMADLQSEDPGSRGRGGRYEASRLDELVPEFAAVAARMPIGEYSQIFETQFGLHFLRVNERRGEVVDYNHILIAFDESKFDPTNAIEELGVLRDSLSTSNIPFELLAKRHSEDEFSSIQGGRVTDPRSGERNLFLQNLGFTWRRTIDTLDVGEISMPAEVELLNGRRAWHIVRVQDLTPTHQVSLQTDYPLIRNLALREKQARLMEGWVKELRQTVYIEERIPTDLSSLSVN